MGETRVVLVARRGGGAGEAAPRCITIISEAPYRSRQVLPRGHLVSLPMQPENFT